MKNPSQTSLNNLLADMVHQVIAQELEKSKAGHCLRVSALPESVMQRLCADFNTNGFDAHVVMLLGPHQKSQAAWQVTATRLIELRNEEERPLLAFIPPGLKAAAEDSFDVSTFVEIRLGDVPRQLRYKLRDQLPANVQSLTDDVIRYLEQVEKIISNDDIVRYYLTILDNGSTEATVGAAIYQLGLVPDFELVEIPDRIRQRLDRNVVALKTLTEGSQPLLGRILDLKLKTNTHQPELYRFLREQSLDRVLEWTGIIAIDPAHRHLAFDQWEFGDGDVPQDYLLLYVDDLKLPTREAEQPIGPDNPLYLDVKRTTNVSLRWETNPKPATVGELAYFRIEIVSTDGAIVWESKNIRKTKGNKPYQSKSLKVAEFREQIDEEDNLYFFRVRAYSDTGQMLNEEGASQHPEILRDPRNPEGKRINESEDVWFWFGGTPPPAEPQRNVTVNSFLEAQLLTQFAAIDRGDDPFTEKITPRTEKTGWATTKGQRAESIYNIVYDTQARYTLPVSNLLRHIESETLARPETLGRWRLNFSEDKTTYQNVQPSLRQMRDSRQIPESFLQARAHLFAAIRAGNHDNLTATTDLSQYQDLILAYATEYRDWLSRVQINFDTLAVREDEGRRRTDPIFLDIDLVEIQLPGSNIKQERVYLIAPTHPLRLLWHLQRAQLARDWLEKAIENGPASVRLTESIRWYLRTGLLPLNLPPVLRPAHDSYPEGITHFYIEQGALTLFWSLYVREDVRDTRTLRARVLRTLGISRQSIKAQEVGGIDPQTLTGKLQRYLIQHPYVQTLKLNVFNPGDASVMIDAILGVEKNRLKVSLPPLRYELRLFTQEAGIQDTGEAVDELLNPERQVSPEADAFSVPGQNHLFPKLKFSRNKLDDFIYHPEQFEAHISILHDLFPIKTSLEAEKQGRSSYVHGLIQEQVTRFTGEHPAYAWQRQLLPRPCRELDHHNGESNLLAKLLSQIANLQASVAAGKKVDTAFPTLCLSLDLRDKQLLYQVHTASDWVFIIDRHLGLEYFDSDTGDDRALYLLDFTPEFSGTDTDRLLLTTRAVDEVTRLIRPVLAERDLLGGPEAEVYFLQLLRSLSGRLALKLLSSPNSASEALGLAMARLFLEQYNLLTDTIILPLDAHTPLFDPVAQLTSPEEELSLRRGDLLLVACQPETRLIHFHLIEVKWRTDLSDFNAYINLRQQIEQQLRQSEETLRWHFDPAFQAVDRLDRQVKIKELIGLLNFYLERSSRYGLIKAQAIPVLRNFIESLDDGYKLTTSALGLIFDFSYDNLSSEEEHAGLVFHRVGQNYIRRLLDNGLYRRKLLQKQGRQKSITIEEAERQQVERQRVVNDTSMRGDESYRRVRSHFQLAEEPETPPGERSSVADELFQKGITSTLAPVQVVPQTNQLQSKSATTSEESPPPLNATAGLDEPLTSVDEEANSSISRHILDVAVIKAESQVGSSSTINLDEAAYFTAGDTALKPGCDILLGDTTFSQQFGLLGKSTDKILGLDLNGTNTISLFGVQGGGKSYTVGSVVEMATQAFPGLNLLPSPLATVIFHYHESQDYQPEFVSMVAANSTGQEVQRLQQEYGISPGQLRDVIILTAPGKLKERQAEFPGVQVEPLFFASDELSFKDWRFLMGAVGNQMYMKQLNMIMRDLRHELTLEALQAEIEDSDLSKSQKRTARVRLEIAGQFIRDSQLELNPTTGFAETKRRLSDWLKPGRLIIVDLRDEFIDKDEALGLFVVMLNIFANAGREAEHSFNKLIVFDEAHKYMDNPELTGHIVDVIRQMRHQGVSVLIASQDPPSLPNAIIELSSVVILHRFNSPLWLKHVQRSITALSDLTPAQMAALRPGEAYVWANKSTERVFTQKAVKVQFRPRVTQHGGGTKEAV